jgi:hypothetical protein
LRNLGLVEIMALIIAPATGPCGNLSRPGGRSYAAGAATDFAPEVAGIMKLQVIDGDDQIGRVT